MKQIVNESKPLIKYKYNIANMVTLLNLSIGCFSLFSLFKSEHLQASILILIGTILDRFDGKIARALGIVSEFGKELDSLSDLVSFGVAPAMLIWSLALNNIFVYGSAISVIFVLSGAFRLARFNVSNCHDYYVGIPITIAGGLLAILALATMQFDLNPYLIAFITLLLSFGMTTTTIKITKR